MATLTTQEIEGLLSRNTDLRLRVAEFQALTAVFSWSQLQESGWMTWTFTVPGWIPPSGVFVRDSVLGTVVIFPDAAGVLRFNTTAGATGSALEVPQVLPRLPSLPSILGVVALVAVAVILFEVMPFVGPFFQGRTAK